MALETIHSVQRGILRLLGAPEDVSAGLPHQGVARLRNEATHEHGKLYEEYVADFAHAYEIGANWWAACVDACLEEAGDRRGAIDAAFDRRLAGPASAPEVVWFFRTYWMAFDEVNKSCAPEDRVPPQHAMLQWLIDDGHDDYIQLLTCMPYWPIGLDENGNWC